MLFKISLIFIFSLSLSAQEVKFKLIHTNDLHSHFEGTWHRNSDGTLERRGHYARLLWEINRLKNEASENSMDTLTVDAGDFFAGTIFHTLGPMPDVSIFPEWDFFKAANYDAVILGNHEFDPGNVGVKTMFAKTDGGPALVSSNIILKDRTLLPMVKTHAIKKIKFEQHEISVAILGILGPNGCLVSRNTRQAVHFAGFNDENSKEQWSQLTQLLNQQIKSLKKTNDIIILVMHAGSPEDEKLAKALDDVDFIVAGHTHKTYGHIVHGVPISQVGSFGRNLGSIDLSYDIKEKKLNVLNSPDSWSIPIFTDGEKDAEFAKRINAYKKIIKEKYKNKLPDLDQVVFTPKKDYIHAREHNNELGTFITTSLMKEIKEIHQKPLGIYFTSMGLIRSSVYKDIPYSVADLFEFLSVGFDENGEAGSKTSIFKLSPKDLVKVIQFLELYGHFSSSFAPAFSNSLSFNVRKYGIPFINRIHNIKIHGIPLDDYKRDIVVATTMLVASNIDLISDKTYGLVKIKTLTLDGKPSLPIASDLPKEVELFISSLTRL